MPICQCGAELPARRRKCDDCKKRPGKVVKAEVDAPPIPAGLRDRGLTLWRGIGQHLDTPAGQLALEACRMADRLDEFENVIAGKGVLNLMQLQLHLDLAELLGSDDEVKKIEITIHIGNVLVEGRQQQTAFKNVLTQLAELKVKTSKEPEAAPAGPGPVTQPTTGLDEVSQRRQQREQEA